MNNNGIIAEGTPHQVITEAILDEIYQGICAVRNLGDSRMVLPKEVAERRGNSTKSLSEAKWKGEAMPIGVK